MPLMANLSLTTDATELRCSLKAVLPLQVLDRMDCLQRGHSIAHGKRM